MANPIEIGWVLPIGHTGPIGNMTFVNNVSDNLTSLEAAIIAVDTGQVICNYRSIIKTSTSCRFNLTDTERNKFIALIPYNKTSAPIRYTLRYVHNGTTYNVYKDTTFSFNSAAAPILSPVAYDTYDGTIALTGNNQTFIRGYSVVYANANPTFQYGALQKSQSIVCGSRTIGLSGAYIENIQSGTITFTITDTRGFTTTQTIERNFIDYVNLSCSLKADLPTTSGTCKLTVKGSYFNGSFGAQSNSLTLHYRYKAEGGSYGNWITATATKSGHSYTATINVTGLDYQKAYTFQARAEDKLAYVLSNEDTVRATPVFDWDRDDFKINVPLILPHGATQGIFTYNSRGDKVYVLQPSNDSNNLVLGYGNYSQNLGDTNIYGQNIHLTSNGYVSINGYKYGENKVLYSSSGIAMQANHTVTLNEKISAQPHGIVLVFSNYQNGASTDSHFNCYFLPKNVFTAYTGSTVGFCIPMWQHVASVVATKYLYFTDTTIKGHANNWEVGAGAVAASGYVTINKDGQRFVLRRVIGV